MPLRKASCLSDIHPRTGLPRRAAHSRAWASNRRTSAAVLEISDSANHTRLRLSSRTTYSVSCPFSGCRPSMHSTKLSTWRYSSASLCGSCCRAAEHLLITPNVPLHGIAGQRDLIAVCQLRPNLGHRPVAGETALTDPAEHVPTNHPPRQADRRLRFWTEGLRVTRTRRVGAVHQLTDQMHRTTQGEDPVMPMIAHVHPVVTNLARTVLDFQLQASERPSPPAIDKASPSPPCNAPQTPAR